MEICCRGDEGCVEGGERTKKHGEGEIRPEVKQSNMKEELHVCGMNGNGWQAGGGALLIYLT